MNEEFVILRILHIVSGVFWAGSAIFLATILEPRLRALGPAVQGPLMRALIPVMVPAMLFSATITIAAGITLALRLRWDDLDSFLNTGWGWAILIGFVAAHLLLRKLLPPIELPPYEQVQVKWAGAELDARRLAVVLPRISRRCALPSHSLRLDCRVRASRGAVALRRIYRDADG